jgi:hypothetical protein
MKRRPDPINRDMGTKRACIADLRIAIDLARLYLDERQIHTALYKLESACREARKKFPAEKIVKPLKK